jgi:hypothetical protein
MTKGLIRIFSTPVLASDKTAGYISVAPRS